MGQSKSMCCAVREKEMGVVNTHAGFSTSIPKFHCIDLEVEMDGPSFMLFGPLWQKAPSGTGWRRIALASKKQVRVYRIKDAFGPDVLSSGAGEADTANPEMVLEHMLEVPQGRSVTSIVFCEETSSRTIAVAFAAQDSRPQEASFVRIWNLDMLSSEITASQRPDSAKWTLEKGQIATLEGQPSPFMMLTTSATYLFGALTSGECIVWQKSGIYSKRGAAKLHQTGVADMSADRNFLYTTGRGECSVSVWAMPELTSVLTIDITLPRSILNSLGKTPASGLKGAIAAPSDSEKQLDAHVRNVTALRLPLSRWAGSQGSQRSVKAPKGSIYVAGVLSGAAEISGHGSGVLMHWTVGEQCLCRSAQLAHKSPIVSMVYGPYDNGPL
eukprot:2534668-Amphidinium_carterae.1